MRVHEGAGDVAHVDVVALEVRLEQHDEAVVDRAIDEIVDQQIDAHARRHAEHGGQPKADRVVALEHDLFRLDLVAPIERDRPQRRILGAEFALFADAVAAVGDRHDDALIRRQHLAQRRDGVSIGRRRGDRVLVAQGRADDRGQRNDRSPPIQQRPDRIGRAGIAVDHVEFRVGAALRQAVLQIHEIVEHGDAMSGRQ